MKNHSLYFIAIIPPPGLRDRIAGLKEEFANTYNSKHALKSPPHITLIPPFSASPALESEFIAELKYSAHQIKPFNIELCGYGAFKPRVIFLKIVVNNALKSLQGIVAERFKRIPDLDIQPGKSFHPHLTLATRDLKRHMFYAAWDTCKDQEFEASFEVSSLYILKHNGKFWDIHHDQKLGVL